MTHTSRTSHTNTHTPLHSAQPAAAADGSGDADSAVDYAFYCTLWSLQSFFADPPKLKQPDRLSSLLSSVDGVLTAFERSPTSASVAMSSEQSTAAYFPKYLSGPRLMHLQLQDSTFRRHLLTKMLSVCMHAVLRRSRLCGMNSLRQTARDHHTQAHSTSGGPRV